MPTLSVVKRHIRELLARHPELAEEIRAELPPPPAAPKPSRRTSAKGLVTTEPRLSAAAPVAPAAPDPDATEPVTSLAPDVVPDSSEAVAPDSSTPATA